MIIGENWVHKQYHGSRFCVIPTDRQGHGLSRLRIAAEENTQSRLSGNASVSIATEVSAKSFCYPITVLIARMPYDIDTQDWGVWNLHLRYQFRSGHDYRVSDAPSLYAHERTDATESVRRVGPQVECLRPSEDIVSAMCFKVGLGRLIVGATWPVIPVGLAGSLARLPQISRLPHDDSPPGCRRYVSRRISLHCPALGLRPSAWSCDPPP